MTAIITKVTKRGPQTITGQVLQNGLAHITVAVNDKTGQARIKRFRKDAVIIRLI